MKTFSELSVLQGTASGGIGVNSIDQYLEEIVPFISKSIEENNNDLIFHSLAILKHVFRNTEPNMVSVTATQQAKLISQFLNSALNHNQSRLASEALRVTGMFITQL